MKLLSLNIGQARTVTHRGKPVQTGIFKAPVQGRVLLRRSSLDGDRQVDLRYHGGDDKAVYAYPAEHYAFWRAELRRDDLAPGQFGENFTTLGLLEEDVCIGDAYRVGAAVLQVTQPRVPCFKLGIRMGSQDFVRRFHDSLRCGFYLRVLEEGEVGAGDAIHRLSAGTLSIRRIWELRFLDPPAPEPIRAVLALPALSAAWRADFEALAARIGA